MHKLLIVSDDDFLRDLVRLSLTDLQAQVRCARDADEMERLCLEVAFDLVIVLRTAPFLSGRDLVRRLRAAGVRRPVFYVLSWSHAEQTVLNLLECGVDQYLTFPVNLQRLRGKVANELTRAL